jgi:aryl carrier-like protein
VLHRQYRQQRLLGAGGLDLRELQAHPALQRWMRCSSCAQYVRQL